MSKMMRKLLAVTLILAMLLSLAACNHSDTDDTEKSNQPINTEKLSAGEVWSLPSTARVFQDETDFANKGAAVLSYQAVRNEYESYQLFITAEQDISAFALKTTDLKKGDAVLSAENIDVYVQKYEPVEDDCAKGIAPDALIPMDVAADYEENTIKAGNNGGLWVTIYVPKETEAGLYEGAFQLTVESSTKKETLDIPVSVEVADYTLTDEVTAETLVSWRYERAATGEMDGSIGMMTYYYEFFQKYRISLQSLPVETLSGEEYIKNVLKYYDRLTTYTILSEAGNISTNLDNTPGIMKEQILAVAAASTVDRNLFDKAVIYFIDEPELQQAEVRETVVRRINTINKYLQECVDTIKADDTGLYSEFKQIENWEKSILDIPDIIPLGNYPVEWLIENENTEAGQLIWNTVNCICPQFDCFTDKDATALIRLTEKYDIELWWYGMSGVLTPFPTWFVSDKNLLSARTLSWLQKKYDITGNLYWDAAGYTGEEGNPAYEFVDLYESPDRDRTGVWQAGDGNLSYPGAAYGVYGALPSLRLMSIRDGLEEYEILRDIEETFEELADSFGADFAVEQAMETFYSTLYYDGARMYSDGESALDFTALRTELLQLVVGLKNGSGFAMGSIEVDNATASFEYYVQEGASVAIDGQKQQSVSGQQYRYVQNLEESTRVEVSVTNADGETTVYNQFVAVPKYILNAVSEESVLEYIKVSENSTTEFVRDNDYSTDGTSVHLNVKGVWSDDELANAMFVPSASIETSLFGDLKLADFGSISMDVYNPGEAFKMKVRIYSGTSQAEVSQVTVEPGKTTLNFNIGQLDFSQMDTIDRIAFEFENAVDETPLSYEFYIDNITGKK